MYFSIKVSLHSWTKIQLGLQCKGQSTTLRSRSNLDVQYQGQTASLRSRSNLDFSVKVKPLYWGQDHTRTDVYRWNCYLEVKIKLGFQCKGQTTNLTLRSSLYFSIKVNLLPCSQDQTCTSVPRSTTTLSQDQTRT